MWVAVPVPMRSRERLVRVTVNGEARQLIASSNTVLIDALRDQLGLTGTKQGCDRGECGACTILLDGAPALACLTLVEVCEGRAVQTVEGLRNRATLHPLQDAFVRHNAAQCGFCTPGMLMSAAAFLESRKGHPPPTRGEVAAALSGNLCRCTGYVRILDAVIDAAARGSEG